MGPDAVTVKKATRGKSMRLTWSDGTPVDVYFWQKGARKSQVQLQHRELASAREATRVRADWTAWNDAACAAAERGDVAAVDAASARLNDAVRAETEAIRARGAVVGILGGDHSSPYGAIAATAAGL